MQPLVIVNPRAGGGHAAAVLRDLRDVIEHRLGPVHLETTTRARHAIDLAREGGRSGCELIVAVGGDGTLHEAANGILDAGGGSTLGFVGLGTGGDFRRTLGITHRLDAYLDAIAGRREALVDVGRLRYRALDGSTAERWFVNVVSAGMGGLVDRYVARTTKAFGGRAAYLAASGRALVSCQRARLRCGVTLDGERSDVRASSYMIAVCNGRYFGGGMHVAPMAKPNDGRFEVISMDAPNKIAFAAYARRIYDANHLSAPGARHFGCERLTLDLETGRGREVFVLDVDGEPLGGLPVEIELVPSALRVRVGRDFGLQAPRSPPSHTS